MMNWNTLLSAKRFGLEEFHQERHETALNSNATTTGWSFRLPSAAFRTRHKYSRCQAAYLCTTD